ncbi:hypothetical protein [Limnoraphis robusta]|uniref:Low temperature-induced protein n=1 Tax=Limnoraphis robusta CCNP1315 TaxID=3110306 RepID=A0ABU5TRF3_9CYAN|nr:hypothetical protein [Limnoraphis robusta]MEA5498480.1 hypothetical protein [Limnoraphis robusta BA-68 BA1]MEA5517449.1 hypothetical protein [Limnoraphis robusta CCNP1315]MEA5545963.1 hypothetical protein [Limnoraphis robusta CCNP1324]
MKRLLSRFQIKVFGFAVLFSVLFFSFNSWSSTPAFAASLTPEADYYQVYGVNNQSQSNKNLDLDSAANRSEEAADKIYQGLDKTKDFIGKTEPRKQVIEKARDHASNRLKEQSERAKSADNPHSLDPNEQNFLKNIQSNKN